MSRELESGRGGRGSTWTSQRLGSARARSTRQACSHTARNEDEDTAALVLDGAEIWMWLFDEREEPEVGAGAGAADEEDTAADGTGAESLEEELELCLWLCARGRAARPALVEMLCWKKFISGQRRL